MGRGRSMKCREMPGSQGDSRRLRVPQKMIPSFWKLAAGDADFQGYFPPRPRVLVPNRLSFGTRLASGVGDCLDRDLAAWLTFGTRLASGVGDCAWKIIWNQKRSRPGAPAFGSIRPRTGTTRLASSRAELWVSPRESTALNPPAQPPAREMECREGKQNSGPR
jgi:hypothetical protein